MGVGEDRAQLARGRHQTCDVRRPIEFGDIRNDCVRALRANNRGAEGAELGFKSVALIYDVRGCDSGVVFCSLCGAHELRQRLEIDRNVLNFERFKWGGVRKIYTEYVWFDLDQFERAEKLEPTDEDYSIFREILSVCSKVPDNERASSLAKRLSGVFKSNLDERRSVIETLGICGILKPAGRPTFFEGFVAGEQREHTGEHYNDWGYPVIWWRGSDGVNADALRHYFPKL